MKSVWNDRVPVVVLQMLVVVALASMALGATSAMAADCIRYLGGSAESDEPRIVLVDSGRDADNNRAIWDAAIEIYVKISKMLGVPIPNMRIVRLSPGDMASLSATSGHPVPYWIDGQRIVAARKPRGGRLYEFVVPGESQDFQFIRDGNSLAETFMVLAHVAGHYSYSTTSRRFQVLSPDQIRHSHDLAVYMQSLTGKVDKAELDRFYLQLQTLEYLQDITRGSFAGPEEFDPPSSELRATLVQAPGFGGLIRGPKAQYEKLRHPVSPTESVLQAFVRNLPPGTPEWKRELVRLYERKVRVIPGFVASKIANEGWAITFESLFYTYSQQMAKFDAATYAACNSGVNYPSLQNPYWLGSEAWTRFRSRLLERPENRGLSQLEQDRLFVREGLSWIANGNDYNFLRENLDADWFTKRNLLMYRKLRDEPWRGKQINVAVTRDPKRMAAAIAQRQANWELKIPKIKLVDFNVANSGRLALRHEPVLSIPLYLGTLAPALFQIAQTMERPVSLQTIGVPYWGLTPEDEDLHSRNSHGGNDMGAEGLFNPFAFEVTVTPAGEVSVRSSPHPDDAGREIGAARIAVLEPALSKTLETFRADLYAGDSDERQRVELDPYIQAIYESMPDTTRQISSLTTHAPTAALAVIEYKNFVSYRAAKFLRDAVLGKVSFRFVKGGKKVRIKVLPSVPTLALDGSTLRLRKQFLPPTPVDQYPQRVSGSPISNLFHWLDPAGISRPNKPAGPAQAAIVSGFEPNPDEDLEIGRGPYLPGDEWEVDLPPKGNGGDGDGNEGDGDDGDSPSDGEGGEGQGTDSDGYIEIPVEVFGQLLARELELKNLRKTDGDSERIRRVRKGAVHGRPGHVRQDRTAAELVKKGTRAAAAQGLDVMNLSPEELVEIGAKAMKPEDYVISNHQDEPRPDFDAVLVHIADTSGSMSESHRKVEGVFVSNERAVLKTIYPNLKEVFIIFDSDAAEVSEKEFFGRRGGGGTNASSALELAQKILEERYPFNRFNRFVDVFSDGDDFSGAASIAAARTLAGKVDYLAYGHVEPGAANFLGPFSPTGGWGGQLSMDFQALANEDPNKVGFAVLTDDSMSVIEALKRYYGKKP